MQNAHFDSILDLAGEVVKTFTHQHDVRVSELKREDSSLELQPVFNQRGPSRYEVMAFTMKLRLAVEEHLPALQCKITLEERETGACYTKIQLG
jgi:hypothetical protein